MSLERSKTFETNSPERGTNSYSLFVLMGMGGSPISETLCRIGLELKVIQTYNNDEIKLVILVRAHTLANVFCIAL